MNTLLLLLTRMDCHIQLGLSMTPEIKPHEPQFVNHYFRRTTFLTPPLSTALISVSHYLLLFYHQLNTNIILNTLFI